MATKNHRRMLIIIIFFILLMMVLLQSSSAEVWHLNQSFALNQSNFAEEKLKAWPLEEYPGSLAFLFMQGESFDVSPYLCFISSPPPSSTFTLSIYIYSSSLVYRGAIVWTANRASPILGSSLSLTLRSDGNLVLLGSDPSLPIWSSNTSHQGVSSMELSQNPISLTLLTSNRSIVWESSDFPSDTLTMYQFLLPSASLVSWSSPTDPSPGPFSLAMEPGGLALYYSSLPQPQPYWIWGFYGFNDSFSVMHTCEPTPLAAFMDPEGALLVNNNYPGSSSWPVNASSYWAPFCSLHPDSGTLPFQQYATDESVAVSNKTFLRLGFDGNLRVYTLGSVWSTQLDLFASDACLLPNSCGPYGVCTSGSQCACPANNDSLLIPLNSSALSLGCQLANGLSCSKSMGSLTQRIMLPLTGLDYFSNKYTPPLNISTQEACVTQCFQNCSCLAAFWHINSRGCYHVQQMESLQGTLNDSNYLAFLKVESRGGKASKSTLAIIAGVLSGTVALLILFCTFVFLRCRKLSADEDTDEEEDTFLDAIPGLPTRFSYGELRTVTNEFTLQLGKGGFGAVYAGVLPNGTKVAVKKLESVKQGEKEFRSEVAIMGGIHHNNLLRLVGFCSRKNHKLLVYELMENGSLDQWLFSDTHKKSQLTWDLRCRIALGTARGLAYLHEDCREKIIHLDVKPQNILLDENYDAKVADFGLSRLVDRDQTHVMTTMRGTPGYLAPDWLKEGVIDEKCDVFSFGMLLMEIISGRKNLDYTVESVERIYYPEWAFWQAQGDVRKLTDANLSSEEDTVQLRRMINTAFLCLLEDPALRPSMSKVVQMLQGHLPVDEIQLAGLHQGLLFILRSPSSFAKSRIEETMLGLLGSTSDTTPLLDRSSNIGVISSFEISTR